MFSFMHAVVVSFSMWSMFLLLHPTFSIEYGATVYRKLHLPKLGGKGTLYPQLPI